MITNTIGGRAHVAGPVFQADSIHGGIHVHQGAGELWVRPEQLPRTAPEAEQSALF
ncbi:hypothetical protein [Kitasatospora sp. NPDC087315]|uniref:hypothetical protein n=1 Tax=Kitasatospora sp. NPDC087315 TaxID=3364069 RepID=UPI00380A8F46